MNLSSKKSSLHFWLVVPFVLQIAGAVGLVSYLSFKAGQEAVSEISSQLRQELSDRVQQQLESYVETPFLINAMNAIAVEQGNLDVTQIDNARSLWQQANTAPATNLIYCGREADGAFLGAGRDSDTPGMPLQIQFSNPATHYQFRYGKLESSGSVVVTDQRSNRNRPYNPRVRPWYIAAKQKQQATWSNIYLDFDDLLPVITASQPVYADDGKTLLGVCATDFLLSVEMDSFLSQIQVGKSGEIFILERSGVLVSSSTSKEESLIVGKGDKAQRLPAIQSQNWLVSETTRHLIERFGDLHRIQAAQQFSFYQNGNQMVQVLPFRDAHGLDWLIVVVVPEADFIEQVQTNAYTTGLLCLLALVGATQVGIFTARRITKPLLQLNQAAKQIADGDWDQMIEVAHNDEVGELARSFNHMVSQLKITFAEKQALNQALTNKQTQLSQILEALPVGVIMVRPESSDSDSSDGSDGYLNRIGQHLLGGIETQSGLSLKQLANYRVYQAGTQQLYPSEKMPILRALQGETVSADDLEIHWADGQIISLEVRAIPVLDATGQVIYAISTLQDITERKWIASLLEEYNQALEREVNERTIALEQEIAERKQVEAALRHSEAQNRAIVGAIPDLIFSTNADGIYLDYSHTNQLEDLVPKNIDPTGRSLHETLPQEVANRHLGYIQLALATGEVQTYEQQIWINNKLQEEEVRVIPTGTEHVLFIIRNISIRKQMESQLQAQQAFLWSVIDVCPYPIFVKDTTGRFLILNQACAGIYGKTVEQMLGKNDSELNPNQQQVEEFQRSNQAVMETGETMIFPNQAIVNADGKTYWYQSIIKPFHNLRGEVQGIIGTSVDISDRKNAEVALQQAKEAAEAANRAKSAFLAGMSHELRTPLNAILGFAQIMQRDPSVAPDQKRNLEIINRSGEHLLELINSVLDLSKIEAEHLERVESSFNLPNLIDMIVAMLQGRASAKGVQLKIDIAPPVPQFVITDAGKLRQVLINLIGNAIKFTDRGTVTLQVSVLEQAPEILKQEHLRLHFAVQDTGAGIAAADLDRIFEAFEQTSSGKKLVEGTGLGLTLSRKFVELMGGTLSVSSTIDQGSTFAFDLPVKLATPPDHRSILGNHSLIIGLAPNQPNYRILVVDDQVENRELLVKLLEPIGFQIELATNGEEAITQWQQYHPDLILMDIRMPILDGLAATQQIRAAEQSNNRCQFVKGQTCEENEPVHLSCLLASSHHIPIIALSASVFHDDRDRALAYGCNEFLKKPFQTNDLCNAIGKALNLSYTYAHDDLQTSHHTLSSEPQASPLSQLSPAWMEQLQQAATSGDDAQILELLHQLPSEQTSLVEELSNLARQFAFDRILTLIDRFTNR